MTESKILEYLINIRQAMNNLKQLETQLTQVDYSYSDEFQDNIAFDTDDSDLTEWRNVLSHVKDLMQNTIDTLDMDI